MASKLIADFTDADKGGGRVRLPEGDYTATVLSWKQESSAAGNPMIVWEFEIVGPKGKGKVIKDYTSLTAKSMWKIRSLLEALGFDVPLKKLDLMPMLKKAKGMTLGITLTDDEYKPDEDKPAIISSKVSDYINADGEEPDDDEDEDEDDDEEDDTPDLNGMDRDELKSYIKENKLNVVVKKSMNEQAIVKAIEKLKDEDDEIEDLDLDEM